MKLYEYLIGGKKHNIPDSKLYNSKSFKNIEKGDHLILWNFDRNFNLLRKVGWKVEEIEKLNYSTVFKGPTQIVYKGDDTPSGQLKPSVNDDNLNLNISAWKSDTDRFCTISSTNDEKEVKKQTKIQLIWEL